MLQKHSIATITKLRSLEFLIKTPLLHILYYINGLTNDFWTRTGGWEFDRSHGAGTSSPSHWQQVEEQAPKPVGWTMWFLLMTLVPVQKLCVNIYIYIYIYMCVHSLYELCYRSYIQRECHSVLAKLHPITFYRIISGECAVPGLNATFCFLWFTNCVLLFDKSLMLWCLWPLVFVLNNILILGIWCSTIPHLPGCFCPWTFFENIGFNTVLTDPFMSHLATQLGYSAGEFQLCNWLSLRRLVSWINHLPPACWSTFWKSNFKQQLGCRFDIMDNESYFLVFWHMQLYMSWYIRSFFGFTFLNIIYFFKYSCTNIFHRRSLYTFYSNAF